MTYGRQKISTKNYLQMDYENVWIYNLIEWKFANFKIEKKYEIICDMLTAVGP